MLIATTGLVLHTTDFSESSVIVKIFTRLLGVRSYVVKGVRGGKNKVKMNLLQPMSYLDMVVYNNPKSNINYIKEMRPAKSLPNVSASMVCSSLLFFMDELLYKTLKEEEPHAPLFDYVVQSIIDMEERGRVDASFPICFLLRTAFFIGVEPLDNYSAREPYFSLEEGRFVGLQQNSTLQSAPSSLLHHYLYAIHNNGLLPMASLDQRVELINMLILYFQSHVSDFRHFHSHEILHAVLE